MSEVIQSNYEDDGQVQRNAMHLRAAFEAFKGVYTVTNPPPLPRPFAGENRWIKAVLAVVLVSAMIVSGSHTIPTFAAGGNFLQAIVGIAGFLMLELMLVSFEFIRTERHYRTSRKEPESLNRFLLAGLGLGLIVLLLVQVEYMLSAAQVYVAPELRTLFLVGMAISAPLLAFFTGGILAMYTALDRWQAAAHEAAEEERLKVWEAALRKSWSLNQHKFSGRPRVKPEVTVTKPEPAAARLLPHAAPAAPTAGSQFEAALNWIIQHPEAQSLSLRPLTEAMKADGVIVGKDTVAAAKRRAAGQ